MDESKVSYHRSKVLDRVTAALEGGPHTHERNRGALEALCMATAAVWAAGKGLPPDPMVFRAIAEELLATLDARSERN